MNDKEKSGSQRRILLKSLVAIATGLFSRKAIGQETTSKLQTEGTTLKTSVYKGRPPVEPLDTMIRFERSDDNNGRPMTHEILSLIHEEKGARSYPWTIYAHLTTNHSEGDACVLCSRLHKNARGWSTGLHSEVFNNAPMVGLGVNVEMTNHYTGSEPTVLYGVNIMACGPKPCQAGLVIKNNGSSKEAIFEKQISLESDGQIGIDLAAKFDAGINMRGNTITLDKDGMIAIRYHNGRIEFLNGDKCVAHIDVNKEDHKL